MDFNFGGLKWSLIAFIACSLALAFAPISRIVYLGILIGVTLAAYQIGSRLLLNRLRKELGIESKGD